MKRLVWIAMIGAVLALAGCNTVEGVGMDIADSASAVRGWIGY
ncbi:MAG: putative small secreted protein [Rhodobacteraceae bacterium HLUCCA12]|nr:MAG: putative small secreted protein [Rhodobacteraceae bacterium HLUCCA12]